MGFDDAPFQRGSDQQRVGLAGVVCTDTRFEGMVWGTVARDGLDATEVMLRLLENGKFLPQLHAVLIDGITVGGLNVVDLAGLAGRLGVPCVAVMRRWPDVDAFEKAMRQLPDSAERQKLVTRAGSIQRSGETLFQCVGASPEEVEALLTRVTDRGHVPEPLRLAHLIGAAVVRGESGRRA